MQLLGRSSNTKKANQNPIIKITQIRKRNNQLSRKLQKFPAAHYES